MVKRHHKEQNKLQNGETSSPNGKITTDICIGDNLKNNTKNRNIITNW